MYFEALASGGDDWYNIVLITAPEGASITFDDGDEEITVSGTGMQYPVPLHNDSSTYSITVDANGFVQTDSVTTSAVSGTVFTKKISYAKITLTFDDAFRGQNFNITDGSISPSTQQVFPSTGNTIDLYVPNTGTWKTSSSAAGESYESKGATVTDIDGSYVDELHTRPDGKTVTPTDDIQTWLECAGIRNKSYTTLEEVLADKETLQTIISDENAVDYMVRSKSWITSDSVVPLMTSNTTPKGTAFAKSIYQAGYEAYKAFNRNGNTPGNYWQSSNNDGNSYIGYHFESPVCIKKIYYRQCADSSTDKNYLTSATLYIEYSNDGENYTTLPETISLTKPVLEDTVLINNNVSAPYWRVRFSNTNYIYSSLSVAIMGDLRFCTNPENVSITDDSTAMRYIGLRNYASDTLLDDDDWCEGICNSNYFESVLNVKVPAMTDDTHPSGVVTASAENGGYEKYKAFDGNINTDIYTTNHGWWPASGSHATGDYIRYEFVNPILANKALIKWSNSQGSKVKLQGSLNGTDWTDLTDELTLPGNSSYNSKDLWLNFVDNDDEFKYYQMVFTAGGNHGGYGYKLQFYGREDVDESVIHIYSAASDNDIHYLDGSTPVTVASTDPDGHGTIARTLLPAGNYDLYSSVAMDPDGDMSTEYFHKEVTVNADTIVIDLMPDDVLYWYGYKDPQYFNNILRTKVTYNTDNLYQTGDTRPEQGFITDYPIKPDQFRWLRFIRKFANQSSYYALAYLYNALPTDSSSQSGKRCSELLNGNQNTVELEQFSLLDYKGNVYPGFSTEGGTAYQNIYAIMLFGKHNPLANFFSAARDTVYYMSGGVQVVVAETNELGEAVVDLSSIPTGVELYSSVAFDPTGDLSTQYYHKTFAIESDGKFHFMPENALYWYGYEASKMGIWIEQSQYSYANITYNTNDVTIRSQEVSGGFYAAGFSYDKTITNSDTKIKCITGFESMGSTPQIFLGTSKNNPPTTAADFSNGTDNTNVYSQGAGLGTHDIKSANIGKYIGMYVGRATIKLKALWVE